MSNVLETIRLQVYQTTPEKSVSEMTIDLWAFMKRHGAEEAARVYAESYRMYLESVQDDRERESEPEKEWAR